MFQARGSLPSEDSFLARFLTLPGERLLVASRKHWFMLGIQIALTLFLGAFFSAASILAFLFFTFYPTLFIASILAIIIGTISLIAKLTIDWYCHLYIVTTRKILEMCYSPLFSHTINDVLLDQVRCTEVDVKKNGIVNELLDKGQVTVTFDRPTHQEEFVLSDIKDAEKIGILLADVLVESIRRDSTHAFWYKQKDKPRQFHFTEEIFPGYTMEVN